MSSDAHKIFPSFAKVEGSLETINSCMGWVGSRTGEHIQVISFYDANDPEMIRFSNDSFGKIRHLTSSLTKYFGWPTLFRPITVITSPYNLIKHERPWNSSHSTIVLNDNGLRASRKIVDGERLFYAKFTYQVIKAELNRNSSFSSTTLRDIYAATMTNKFLEKIYGPRFILNYKEFTYNQTDDSVTDQNEVKKLKILSILLAAKLSIPELQKIFQELRDKSALNLSESVIELSNISPSLFGEKAFEYLALLKNINERDQIFDTLDFADFDSDGLFDAYEFLVGTFINNSDSDDDGWLDSTEMMKRRNPMNLSDKPDMMIVDGFENDWFLIIPQKLSKNNYVNSECPASADITYYSAVFGPSSIVILGTSKESSLPNKDGASHWFVDIKIQSFDLTVNMKELSPHLIAIEWQQNGVKRSKTMYRNFVKSTNGIEWELPLNELNIGWLPKGTKIEVKLATSFSPKRLDLCDETSWIEPLSI